MYVTISLSWFAQGSTCSRSRTTTLEDLLRDEARLARGFYLTRHPLERQERGNTALTNVAIGMIRVKAAVGMESVSAECALVEVPYAIPALAQIERRLRNHCLDR